MKELLKNRLYITSLTSDIISNIGDIMFYLALVNYVVFLESPEYGVAILTISETLPGIFAIFLGYFADKSINRVNKIALTLVISSFLYMIIGFLMGYSPALWIVIVAAVINFLSDIIGQYESSLFLPISLKVVPNELREKSIAFKSSIVSTINIIARVFGILLIGILSYSMIAYINSATFIIALLIFLTIYKPLKNIYKDEEKSLKDNVIFNRNMLKEFKNNFKIVLEEIKSFPEVISAMLVIPFINAILFVINPIFILLISKHSDFIIINSQTTIATFPIVLSISSIFGSIVAIKYSEKFEIMPLLITVLVVSLAIFVSLYFHKIYLSLIFIGLIAIIVSLINPKLSALIQNNVNPNIIGTVFGFLGTSAQIVMVIVSFIFSWAITFVNIKVIILIFVLLNLILIIKVQFFSKNDKIKNNS
ncbi:MFS transporter [Gemelliphila palaticanis]|uniref:MFS transporter n=1 Tax=Gemelliphila palaticanis TaxID=81950 RepID=A0ABX2SZL4_9BACL|nr:MFS transporter [Gemella palaticanis]MBF0715896.1 MFS transporter [Gemella palaticanis]NYS47826.1 MFS transporter [Gemella palaticanis]